MSLATFQTKIIFHFLAFIAIAQPLFSDHELFNLDLIYNTEPNGFVFSLPRPILESYLSGRSFDYQKEYNEKEQLALRADIVDIYQAMMDAHPIKTPLAIITAGSPGTGKTILLKQDRAKQREEIAYIDPDDVCLKSQVRTYQHQLALAQELNKETKQEAYNKWRPASNGAALLILAHLIRQKYAFYYGSALSSPSSGFLLAFLKKQGYYIKLLHITASDDVRWNSIAERDKIFVQTTEQDIREKGKMVPERIQDTYLKYADEIEFYFRSGVKEDAQLAARWNCHHGLHILDPTSYEQIKKIHNEIVLKMDRGDLTWESIVEK